jgi:hypothetical protein
MDRSEKSAADGARQDEIHGYILAKEAESSSVSRASGVNLAARI